MKRMFAGSQKSGLPPGTMVYTGRQTEEPTRILVMDYDAGTLREQEDVTPEETARLWQSERVAWINVNGLNDMAVIGRLGETLNLHPLVMEDILHTMQRPKVEDLGDYIFLVVRMLYFEPSNGEIHSEQVSFILTEHCLVSFQEKEGDVFDSTRERLRKNLGRIRKMGADYLLYALMDAIVDNYFLIMEKSGERIEVLEQALMDDPGSLKLNDLYAEKRELLYLRRAAWPLREAIGELERGKSTLFQPQTEAYLRDLYDHAVRVIETAETFRDMLTSVQELYLSSLSQKTNQVMQVLTIIATIFIPLTFVVGVYGMNFEHMPELRWVYGYPAIWGVMLMVAAGMVLFFRRQRWF